MSPELAKLPVYELGGVKVWWLEARDMFQTCDVCEFKDRKKHKDCPSNGATVTLACIYNDIYPDAPKPEHGFFLEANEESWARYIAWRLS